jgi:predicted RNA binding protein YcfA (HicA-like mRNA interferase family)
VNLLTAFGFTSIRQTISHNHLLHRENNRLLTIPSHPEIAMGTLLAILRKADINPEVFLKQVK